MMSPARIRNDFSHMAVYVICVAMLLSGCSRPREERLAPGSVVLALGDSITAGYGIARDRAWPAQLAARGRTPTEAALAAFFASHAKRAA